MLEAKLMGVDLILRDLERDYPERINLTLLSAMRNLSEEIKDWREWEEEKRGGKVNGNV